MASQVAKGGRHKILFISGNYSRILSRLDRNFTELEVRRPFTSFQLMTILEENHHSFVIMEHDPMLYQDASEMVEYVAQALKQTSREATVLLYSPALDPPPSEDDRNGRPGILFLRDAECSSERPDKGRNEDSR